ncbi:MalM family protein [uncultured Thiodictyon sp.]|uniref:MalM family protein n=1 Tax=uncultured Thiodictyon sp. TaxID=1846217 RepID=UPI0025E713A9|nr:MalM family protein [uncultured Thiodictyon sp.]
MPRTVQVAALALSCLCIAGCAGVGPLVWPGSLASQPPLAGRSPMYTAVSPSAAMSQEVLNAAPICCKSLSELHFAPLNTTAVTFYPVDAKSQAFDFATGKSLLQAFEIPDDLEHATLTIDAIAGATVFVPTVLILDRDFRVSRAIDSKTFRYTPAGFMEPQRLRGKVYLDRQRGGPLAAEKYLIVFTTDQALSGSTRMMSEAKLYARAQGLDDPGLPDPVAQHAATGVFRMTVGDLETAASRTQFGRQRRGARRYVAVVPRVGTRASRTARPAAGTTARPPMLAETQTMYNRMIQDSVELGDMDRAWRLVQEAERAGSASARQAFLTAVENK